jgi:RNA polymerase sigma-70 factor (ECF subfamily)
MATSHAGSLPERWDAVLEHRDRALRVARARLSDPYDVDDCVQEGMARVVAMPNLDLGRVGPLLSTVVANVAADTHRQHLRSTRLTSKVERSQLPAEACDEPVCDAAEARWLRTKLDTLGERERSVVQLRAEGRTVAETAAALGMTYKAAESAFTRGRNALKVLWRATLVAVGALPTRTRFSQRGAGAAVLAAAVSLTVLGVQFGPVEPAGPGSREAHVVPAGTYRSASQVSASVANQRPAQSPARPSGADRQQAAAAVATLQPPGAGKLHPAGVSVSNQNSHESLAATLDRCLKKGITISPSKVRCRA